MTKPRLRGTGLPRYHRPLPMKRPLQAILIAGEEMQLACDQGRKRITIREGHRDYRLGKTILCCPITRWCREVRVTSVKRTTLRELTQQELNDEGFENRFHAEGELKRFYPDIGPDSEVTVIRWTASPIAEFANLGDPHE